MVNLIVKQERAVPVEPLCGKQLCPCRSSATDKHFLSATENERLNSNENLVEKPSLQHEAIHHSTAEYGNALVDFEQFRKIYFRRINKSDCPSTRESFRATRKDESISLA